MGWVYIIKNKVNDKSYIGQTRQSRAETRWSQEKNRPHGLLKPAFKKHGIDAFEFNVICEVPNEELNDREILEISQRNTVAPNGYNLEAGGKVKTAMHPSTKVRISESLKGKPKTPEHREKLATAQKGKKATLKARENMSKAGKGKIKSLEMRSKLSASTKGVRKPNLHNYGRVVSDETKQKISDANKGKGGLDGSANPMARSIQQLSLNGELIATFETMKEASEHMGCSSSAISKCCLGVSSTSTGFKWKYLD